MKVSISEANSLPVGKERLGDVRRVEPEQEKVEHLQEIAAGHPEHRGELRPRFGNLHLYFPLLRTYLCSAKEFMVRWRPHHT